MEQQKPAEILLPGGDKVLVEYDLRPLIWHVEKGNRDHLPCVAECPGGVLYGCGGDHVFIPGSKIGDWLIGQNQVPLEEEGHS
ncbi:MAG: hypothetical protein V3R83_09650 [Gammaproteobacteria bacterium]